MLLFSFVWSLAIASVIVVSYWLLYVVHPEITLSGILIYTESGTYVPSIVPAGYMIILAASLIVGLFLVDFERVVVGWVASTFLSFSIAVFGSFLFVWFILGVGQNPIILAVGGRALTLVFEKVSLNVFRMFFPIVPLACLLTSIFGAIVRSIIQPSVES